METLVLPMKVLLERPNQCILQLHCRLLRTAYGGYTMKRYRFDSLIRGTALMLVVSLFFLMTSCDKGLAAVTDDTTNYPSTCIVLACVYRADALISDTRIM